MSQVLIVGGGVIGLSLAYELARRSAPEGGIQLIDRAELGHEASWAGAGILPPANTATARHPYDHLRGLSFDLHPQWSERLHAETGIDNGFRRCGGLYFARTAGEAAALRGLRNALVAEQIDVEQIDPPELDQLEPAVAAGGPFFAAYHVPSECQLRNPRHLRALATACQRHGVELLPNIEATDFVVRGERLEGIKTTAGVLRAEQYCLTGGAWTQQLLARLDIENGILPLRGQMLLYRCERKPFTRILNEGNRYMVARDDGRVLVGSTEEEVGFDKRTTEDALRELRSFAAALVPALAEASLENAWAGLRPATFDGFPYLGRIPTLTNVFVAAGHFRSGLYLSPGTAVVMADLLTGEGPGIEMGPFRLGRG